MKRWRAAAGLCAAFLAAGWSAAADQAAYMAAEDAQRALEHLAPGQELRHYCEPCGDTRYIVTEIRRAEALAAGHENWHEVRVNGTGVDLAYAYVRIDGAWRNLALHLGLAVTGVPEVLPETLPPPPPYAAFPRSHYHGRLGEGGGAVLLEIAGSDGQLAGEARRVRTGMAARLDGEVAETGRFRLTEYAEGERIGAWTGAFEEDGAVMRGTWRGAAGDDEESFTLTRVARGVLEDCAETRGALTLDCVYAYPYFARAADAPLQAAVSALLSAARAEFLEAFAQAAQDMEVADAAHGHALELAYDLQAYSPRFASILYQQYTYAGGAHGMHAFLPLNLLRTEAEGVRNIDTLDAAFDPGQEYVARLLRLCIADLARQEAQWVIDAPDEALTAEGLELFSLDPAGITFHFPPYAVGPYVQGDFHVRAPLSEIASLLRPEVLAALEE